MLRVRLLRGFAFLVLLDALSTFAVAETLITSPNNPQVGDIYCQVQGGQSTANYQVYLKAGTYNPMGGGFTPYPAAHADYFAGLYTLTARFNGPGFAYTGHDDVIGDAPIGHWYRATFYKDGTPIGENVFNFQ